MADYANATASLFGLPGLQIGQAPQAGSPAAPTFANGDPLTPPQDRLRDLAAAFTQQGATMPVHGYGDMIRGLAGILLGNKFGGEYTEQQKAYNKAIGDRAAAAIGNPHEMMKVALQSQNPAMQQAVIQASMSPKEGMKLVEGPTDMITGTPTKLLQEPLTGKLYHLDGKTPYIEGQSAPALGGAPVAGGTQPANTPAMTPQGAVAAGLHGDDFLQTLPPPIQARVKAIADGDEVVQRGDKMGMQLLNAVYQYDPKFDRTNMETRFNFKKSFTDPNHTNMKQALALNNMVEHGGQYMNDILPNMPDNWTSWGDKVSATIGNLMKDEKYKEAYSLAKFLGPESVRVASGAEGGEEERQAASKEYWPEAGKTNIAASLRTAGKVGESKLKSLLGQWQSVMGDRPIPPGLIYPQALETFQKMKTIGEKPQPEGQSQAVNRADKSGKADLAAVASKEDYDKLPKGAEYIAPDGSHRVKQ